MTINIKIYTCKLCPFECAGRKNIRDHIKKFHKKEWKGTKALIWGNDPLSDFYKENGEDVPNWRKKRVKAKEEVKGK